MYNDMAADISSAHRQPGGGVMRTTLWLRISAIVSLLFGIGHSLGGMQNWSPIPDNPVIQSMRTVSFHVMGVDRTYLDFYRGFGYCLSVSMFLQAALLWMLGSVALAHSSGVRPMIAAFIIATVLGGLISSKYIFPIPALFSLVLCATLIVAFVAAGRMPAVSAPVGR